MSHSDALGDRMKAYERLETGQKFLPLLPIYARIDGRGFSRFTKGFERPYDERFRAAMLDTVSWLVEQTNARIGYTQSDEISLCWQADRYDSSIFFDGKKQKMVSQLAALATQRFNRFLWNSDDAFVRASADRAPTFDARVFQFPTQGECANAFLWRELDATKNALSMAAREFYPHKELMGKNGAELHELLFAKGVNFNDYPAPFKRGVYVQRRRMVEVLEPHLLEKIPVDKRPVDGKVERNRTVVLDLPPLSRIANRDELIFSAADPILHADISPPSAASSVRRPSR